METKGTDLFENLPPPQQDKITCGRAHFAALEDKNITFAAPVASYSKFDDIVNGKADKENS